MTVAVPDGTEPRGMLALICCVSFFFLSVQPFAILLSVTLALFEHYSYSSLCQARV